MRLSQLLPQTIAWILERKQTLRVASLACLYLAMFGPWVYDRIYVPAEYSCNFPNFRLEGDYCGVPLSGISILFMVREGLDSIWGQYLAGNAVFPDRARELPFLLSFILLPLPFFSTSLVLFKRKSRGLQIFQLGMWALGTALGLFWFVVVFSFPSAQIWRLWGFWSYLVAAIGMLVLESLVLNVKKTSQYEDWKLKYNV